jgi:hypothetical protein
VYAENRGKMTLKPRCKAYTAHVTLYASSKLTLINNITKDFVPEVSLDFDCCFDEQEQKKLDEIKLDIPLNNAMSSIDDLRIASVKVDEMKQMIKEQEQTDYYKHIISSGLSIGTITFLFMSICLCCYCCKCCRLSFFWLWKKQNPKNAYDDCINGCRKIKNSYNNPHHNTIIAPNVHTLNVQNKDELSQALTESLIELDNIGSTMHKPHQKLRDIKDRNLFWNNKREGADRGTQCLYP